MEPKKLKVIIVGGVAGGASCAARLRRLEENAEILMVERGPYVSYANCGLPYYVGGVIARESSLLVATEQTFRTQFAIEVRTRCEAIRISPQDKTVDLRNTVTGEVTTESYDGVLTVNGQSYAERRTENTNFAILVRTSFTEPFNEPIAYGKYVARLSNLLSGGVIIQRLGDLESGRRSTTERIDRSIVIPTLKNATPGDLSFVLPYRYLADIREMLQALDTIAPGIHSRDTLLYGVEVKFYSSRLQLSNCLESKIQNMFTVGDGAGVTRGLIQASASGVIVAREILKREKSKA